MGFPTATLLIRVMAMSDGLDDFEFNTETHEIVCEDCETQPRLKSLDKNSGTVVGCDCDDARHSQDSIPYEFSVHHMPDSWTVVENGSAEADELPDDQRRLVR